MVTDQSVLSRSMLLFVFGAVIAGWPPSAAGTALDDYVAAPEPNYTYSLVNTISGSGYTGYILDMKSQNWRDEPNEVDRSLWQHWVRIIKPDTVSSTKALLWISGGSNGGSPPGSVDSTLALIATSTGSVVVELNMIPNQPIKFVDETDPRYIATGRKEDELIAYAWDKFLRTGDPLWAPRLPMTKAAVKAMDTITAFCASPAGGSITVDEFVVAGGSKRGWTTWTVGAVEPLLHPGRVVAIIPAVIDVLNVEVSMTHHYAAYGYWAPAIEDYVDMNIMGWFGTPEIAALMALVDPYSYRDRYAMPKYIINSSGDDFFLPDSSQFYFGDLPGEKVLCYVPNTDHGLNADAWLNLLAYYQAIVNGTPRPQFSWTLEGDDTIRVQTDPNTAPTQVKLWQATNPDARDFRKNPYLPGWVPTGYSGPVWSSSTLTDQGGGLYIGQVAVPSAGWRAFFVELTFPSGGANPFKFTTEVRVVPEAATLTIDVRNAGWGRVHDGDPNWPEVDPNFPRYYEPNAAVTLTAEPISGKYFDHWTIFDPNYPDDANYAAIDTNSVLTIMMPFDRHLEARFKCGSGMETALPVLGVMAAMFAFLTYRARRRG